MATTLGSDLLTKLRTQHFLSQSLPISKLLLPTFHFNHTSDTPFLHHREVKSISYDADSLRVCDGINSVCMTFDEFTSSIETRATDLQVLVFNLFGIPANQSSLSSLFPSTIVNQVYTPSKWNAFLTTTSPEKKQDWPTVQELLDGDNHIILCFGRIEASDGYELQQDLELFFNSTNPICSTAVDPIINLTNATLLNATSLPITNLSVCGRPAPNVYMSSADPDNSGISPVTSTTSLPASSRIHPWAFASMHETADSLFNSASISQAVSCGFSPVFSISKSYDDISVLPELMWSWRQGFPTNATSASCAVINSQDGRWTNIDCTQDTLVSCQNSENPMQWIIAGKATSYTQADALCPPSYQFATPKTPQENTALLQALRANSSSSAMISLNQLNRQFCWLTDTTTACPYQNRTNVTSEIIRSNLRTGIVLLFLIAIFVYFKVNQQIKAFKSYKRRAEVRRKIRLLDVNGVPA